MRRFVIDVDKAPGGSGWMVQVHTTDQDGARTDVVKSYHMAEVAMSGRRVPACPRDRLPGETEPHAPLCAGDTAAIAALLDRIRMGTTEPDDVGVYGRWLFECLLAPAWKVVRQQLDGLRRRELELALRWPVDAADLHRLVWESMRDDHAPLAGHPDVVVAITRLVPAAPVEVRTITAVPRVLFATGVPLTDPTIRPGAMFMGLLRALDASGRCRARALQGCSVEDLRAACDRFTPEVVHLVAHGVLLPDGRGALMLKDEAGGEREADATALLGAVSATHRPLAVALSACNTASPGESADDPADAAPLAAQLVMAGIPMVSAMAGEVSELACRLYTRRLTEAIHQGRPIVEASAHGRRAALVGSAHPSADIHWALPALFLNEHLDPGQRLVDATRVNALIGLAKGLTLQREPVFIGRQEILAAADRMVEPDSDASVIVIASNESTSGLGFTRILREIGWRLLRDGHVPVLLGPYQDKAAPTTDRELIREILRQVVSVSERMNLTPFVPATLGADPGDTDLAALEDQVHGLSSVKARTMIRRELVAFGERTGELDRDALRDGLAEDFATLASRAEQWGEPFGPVTRAVLLCDDVHAWAAPTPVPSQSALGCLLAMVDSAGLGRDDRPVPVVVAGSKTADAGPVLGTWTANGDTGFRVYTVGEFAPDDALLGYQWVLLHPWVTKPADERALYGYGHVYTAAPGQAQGWERALGRVARRPISVALELYIVARTLADVLVCRRDDDEHAWRDYADRHPEFQL